MIEALSYGYFQRALLAGLLAVPAMLSKAELARDVGHARARAADLSPTVCR